MPNPARDCGSVIEVQNQTLGEAVAVAGTPFDLHYQSDRTPGHTEASTLEIPLTGASFPASRASPPLSEPSAPSGRPECARMPARRSGNAAGPAPGAG